MAKGKQLPFSGIRKSRGFSRVSRGSYIINVSGGGVGSSGAAVWGAITGTLSDQTDLNTALSDKADLVGGVVPSSQIPAIAITEYLGSVADQTAMLALTGQKGDWCSRTDTGSSWVITGNDPSLIGDWVEISYPSAPVTSVNGYTGVVVLAKADLNLGNVDNTSDANKPVSIAQQAALDGKADTIHGHAISDVTGLQTALDGKASTSHTHVIGDTTGLQAALDAKVDVNNGVHTGNTDLGTAAWAASSFYVGAGSNRTYIDGVYGLVGVLGNYVKIKNGINIQGDSYAFILQSIFRSSVISYVSASDYKVRMTGEVYGDGAARKWIEVDSIVGAAIIKLFGAITTDSTINGRDIATDGGKLDTIEANAKDDQSASEVPFTPNGDIAASNVQAAIVEVRDDTDTKLSGKSNTGHTHTASDISDFDTEVSNNASVAANTAKVSADGSVGTHSDFDLTGVAIGYIPKWNGSSFVTGPETGGAGGSPLTNNTVQQVTATATTSIDLANGHVILMKHDVNIDQISFTNQPTVGEWILIRKSGTSTSIDFNNSIGWPSDIFFDNGTAPTFTAAEQVAWKFIKAGTDDKIRAYEIFRYEVGEQELMIGKNDAPLYKRVRVGTWADHSSLSGGASAYAYHMKYAPNNTYFVWSSNSSSYLHLYDSEPLSGAMSNLGITGVVSTPHYNIAWYPDSTYYIVGISASPYMKKYLVSGGASSETVGGTAPASACLGVAFSPDGSYFAASFNSSPYLRVWNVVDPTDMSTWTDVTLGASLSGTGTSALAFSPDGSELVAGVGSTSPYFERYDTSTWAKKSNPASLPGTAVWGAVYSNDGSLLCLATAGAGTERLVVYDRSDMSKVTITGGQPAGGEAYAIDITPDDKYLAIGHNSGGYVTIYNVSDWTTVSHGMSFTGYPRTLAFSNLFLQG